MEVLDRVLDKGIVTTGSLRLGDSPIELAGRPARIVAETAPDMRGGPERQPRVA
jgi:hypothetical protein